VVLLTQLVYEPLDGLPNILVGELEIMRNPSCSRFELFIRFYVDPWYALRSLLDVAGLYLPHDLGISVVPAGASK
jgi:hypothetical protein